MTQGQIQRELAAGGPAASAAEARAAEIYRMCVAASPEAPWEQCPTCDGGMTVDAEAPATGRDLLFATPDTAGILYFTARAPGERHAGVVTDDRAVPRLARWVVTDDAFSGDGLVLAPSDARVADAAIARIREEKEDSPLAAGIVIGVLVVCAVFFTWWLTLMPSPTP